MQFKDIIGHSELKKQLISSVRDARVSHALLFSGDHGSGTLPLALAFAQYLNCESPTDEDSCGVCPSCYQNAQLAHPDLHFTIPVNAAKGGSADKLLSDMFMPKWREQVLATGGYFNEQMWYQTIDIDNKQGNISKADAEEVIRKLSFKSFGAGYKIMVIWQPERMNVQAANSLLKIIEEPWDKTIFLLVSTSPDKLLTTIISRTQSIAVPCIDIPSLGAYLSQKNGLSAEDGEKFARLAQGNLIEAQRLIENSSAGDEMFELFVGLMRLSYENRHLELIEWAESVASMGREQQKLFINNSLRLLRDSYMLTCGVPQVSYLFGAEAAFCKKFAPYVNNKNIEALIAEMELALRQISQNGNPKIVFTHFALSVSKMVVKI